jgi:hypothetical protein
MKAGERDQQKVETGFSVRSRSESWMRMDLIAKPLTLWRVMPAGAACSGGRQILSDGSLP